MIKAGLLILLICNTVVACEMFGVLVYAITPAFNEELARPSFPDPHQSARMVVTIFMVFIMLVADCIVLYRLAFRHLDDSFYE